MAGAGRGRRVWEQIEPLLRAQLPDLTAHLTRSRGEAERLAAEFAARHSTGIAIVVGGDGSIHEVTNGLLDAGYDGVLAIVPAGTGNDIARNLGIPTGSPPCQPLALDRPRPLDVGRVALWDRSGEPRHRWFLNSLSVGTSARANRIARSIGAVIRSPVKYPVAGVVALFSGRTQRYEVLVGGRSRYQGKAINLTIANGACFGGGLRISPDSRPDDGALELVIIGAMGLVRALGALRRLRQGRHVSMGEVEVDPAVTGPITIRTAGELPFETDGENLVTWHQAIVNLVPGRLKVAR